MTPAIGQINPSIFYWGTPVVLVSTLNLDGSANLSPMSSAFWLADRCMLGLLSCSQTTRNLRRSGHCALNLPSSDMAASVDAIARTTGAEDVPGFKRAMGYSHVKDKFSAARLTPIPSEIVQAPRVEQCPVQMEAEIVAVHEMGRDGDRRMHESEHSPVAIEVKILKTYIHETLRMPGHVNRVDPERWRPLIMSFQKFYGLSAAQVGASHLAEIDEEAYRS